MSKENAVLVFAAGAAIAPFMPLLGFATVCCARLLYLRPEAISGLAKQIKSKVSELTNARSQGVTDVSRQIPHRRCRRL